jgi:hypothetical protein
MYPRYTSGHLQYQIHIRILHNNKWLQLHYYVILVPRKTTEGKKKKRRWEEIRSLEPENHKTQNLTIQSHGYFSI